MNSQKSASYWQPGTIPPDRGHTRFRRLCLFFAVVLGGSASAPAKDSSAIAVFLYDGPQGAAYAQITGLTLNGKTEVRVCDGVSKFDKKAYDALPRVPFSGATSLQRGADGVLTLTVNAKTLCVVPGSLKFERKVELTPAEAADQSVVQGVSTASSNHESTAIPPMKPGVQLVFIAAPDLEVADFLRAARANAVKDWQDFLVRYPSTTRRAAVQKAIAGLHQQAADAAFAQYKRSAGTGRQSLAMLRQACLEAQAASQASAGYDPAIRLMDSINRELDSLLEPDRARLQAYQRSLQDHTTGYSLLAAATLHVEQVVEVRPEYTPALNLRNEIASEEQKLEMTIGRAESLAASGRYDDAANFLGPYSAFAPEMPRVDAIFTEAFKYHLDSGQKLAAREDWERAVAEFRKATMIRPDNKDATAALNNATVQLAAQHDQQAANLAIVESNEYSGRSQFVEAYNVLADLPDRQRALVTSQLSALSHNYVSAATRRAQKLQDVHLPIQSRADEDAVREAYTLLDRASSLSGDPAITLKRDFLSAKISSYYVDQANRYLAKPSGSGAGVGWLYLKEAQRYGVTNLVNLKDLMARYAPLYQRRARLSVGIVLRDQTSLRDSPGFASQLADAIANGLESSGLSVEVVRGPSETTDALQPNFMLVGEVLEHRVVNNASLETPESRYRVGTHEVRNPAWIEANSDYTAAQQQLAAAQQTLNDARSQHNTKDVIAAANDTVQQAQAHLDDLQHKLETTDQNRVEAVVEPYHYTRKNIDLNAAIELAFRMSDQSGNVIGQPGNLRKNNHKTAIVVQDVKPEDTEGVTNQGVEPDQVQFLTDLEIEARTALVKAVRDKASELPAQVLQQARASVQQGDVDGAAEQYVIYLNSTPEGTSPERDEAVRFLHDRFNLTIPSL